MNPNIKIEKVCDAPSNLSSPFEDVDGYLYLVTQNGEVMKVKDGHVAVPFPTVFQITNSY